MAKNKEQSTANYSATISETSMELTAREKVMFKDTQNAVSLLDLAKDAKANGAKAIVENIKGYVVLDIHNEKSEDKDYTQYIVVDKSGEKYVTGSPSFWDSFMDIVEEMKDYDGAWAIKVYRMPSKNHEGKDFITCSVI